MAPGECVEGDGRDGGVEPHPGDAQSLLPGPGLVQGRRGYHESPNLVCQGKSEAGNQVETRYIFAGFSRNYRHM